MPPTSGARLRDARVLAALGLAAGITVPAALLGGPQAGALPSAPAALAADEQPVCGDPGAKDFPIDTRIQGAPDRYASGGGYGTWFLDLTNTTDAPCRALHPVLVLADRDRRLTSDQIQLEFSEPGRPGTEHRVTWESTDHDEQIGVFGGDAGDVGDPGKRGEEGEKGERGEKRGGGGEEAEKGTSSGTGTGTGTEGSGDSTDSGDSAGSDDSAGSGEAFLGFTVPAGKTVSVRVRMAFTSDTAPGPVTAHAAVVQRRHQDKAKGGGREDGEWVGESEEYPFVIIDGATGGIREPERPRPERPRTESPQPERPQRESPEPEGPRAEEPRPERTGPGAGARTEGPGGTGTRRTDPGADQGPSPSPSSDRDSTPRPPTRPADGDEHGDGGRGESEGGGVAGEDRGEGRRPGLPHRDGPGSPLPELARTGPVSLTWTGVTAGALLVGGAALVLHARRLRRLTD
ncbi:peptidase [Streptomyces sp. NPDC006267]|uniref:peptidase n=1 Tax=Streptomyces sp. NPDC006267 TaxID=3157173 RepID=UPI0033BE0FFA